MNRRLHRLARVNRTLVLGALLLLVIFGAVSWVRYQADRRVPPPPVTDHALRGGQIVDATDVRVVIQPIDQAELHTVLIGPATTIRVLVGEEFRAGSQADLATGAFLIVAGEALVAGDPVREIHVMGQRSEDGAE